MGGFSPLQICQMTPPVSKQMYPKLKLFGRNWHENMKVQCVEQLVLTCQNKNIE